MLYKCQIQMVAVTIMVVATTSVPAPGNTSQCLYPDGIATGHIITSVSTDSKTTTLNDIRMTRPVISVTPAGRKVTAGSQRFAAAVNKVLAAISKGPSDINTVTPSISRVNTVVTNFIKDISRIHGRCFEDLPFVEER